MKRTVPAQHLKSQSRFIRVLWLYSAAKALGLRSTGALSAIGLLIALPLARRALQALIARTKPPLREMRALIRRCLSALKARITRAAREIIHLFRSVTMTATTVMLVWGFFLSELMSQFRSALRQDDFADAGEEGFTGAEQEADFLSEEDLLGPFARMRA